MNYYKIFLSMCLTVLTLGWMQAQTMEQGNIKMEIVDVKVSQPEMQQMVGAMKGSVQDIYFDKNRQQVIMDMMGGMVKMQMFQDFSDNTTENYMDMMGQKIKTVMTSEQMEEQKQQSEQLLAGNKIKYDKSDTKNILGYDCYKGTLNLDVQGNKMTMTFYLTDKIKVPQAFIQNMNHLEIEGTPLEFTMDMDMMTMTYKAVSLSDDLPADFFKKPEGEYRTMTMEELQKMGMGGQMGF